MTDGSDPRGTRRDSLDPERWRQIDALFAAALELDPAERSRWLDAECEGDPDLRRAVTELLLNDRQVDEDFLEPPVPRGTDDAERNAARAAAGDVIGPYRVERELARGGMGSVYLAHRADDVYQRQVAIKLLDRASETMARRFRGERQILASLNHPHIAGLFEGGETPADRPYLVMEYVDGLPIDDYCDRQELGLEERLELFGKVCSAVHYAHQNLVVHRDIKPSNVLVDAGGEPRLLDFGIAKLLDPEAFPLTLDRTATGERPMTPHYASPEQVRGDTITTASDVYSLGVLLYKLLTGRLPHRLSGLSVLEIDRVLTGETPLKASIAVATPSDDESFHGARSRQLARRLAGDLDNIVAMALRPEPGRRYGSAEQLAQDLTRHLSGQPVMARRDTFGYRMSVFLRRNKLAAGVAALVLMLIVAFAVSSARQAAATASQRDRAELERDKARQVSAFLVDLFREGDPWETPGNDLTVREVLDRGAIKIERELVNQPEVRATLLQTIGTVYTRLGMLEQAAPHLETALETIRDRLGDDHPDVASVATDVAFLYRRQGKYEAAELLYLRALEIRKTSSSADDRDAGMIHGELSRIYRIQGRFDQAQERGERALTILEATLGSEHRDVVSALGALAAIAVRRGEPEVAAGHLQRALSLHMKSEGELNLRSAAIYANLGLLRLEAGALEEAGQMLERGLALYGQLLEEPHERIGNLLVVMANLATAQDDGPLAEQRLQRALDNYRRTLGDEHDLVANCLLLLGMVVLDQGRPGEAEPLLERSLAIREEMFAPDHHSIAESLRGLGKLRVGQERHAEAERLYVRAMGIWEKHPQQQGTQGVPEAYAALLRATGRDEEATALEQRVETRRRSSSGH